jgi:hypothetical protein
MVFTAFQNVRQVHTVPDAVFLIKKQITALLKILDFKKYISLKKDERGVQWVPALSRG